MAAMFPLIDNQPLKALRKVSLFIILIEYGIQVTNLSTYNSPSNFPPELLHGDADDRYLKVYPNEEHYYMYIPWFFKVAKS